MELSHVRKLEQTLSDSGVSGHVEPIPGEGESLVYIDIVASRGDRRLGHAAVREVLARLGMLQGVDVGHAQRNKGGRGYPALVVECSGETWVTLRDEAAYEIPPQFEQVRDYWEKPPF